MENSKQAPRRRAPWVVGAIVLLALAWLGRESLWQVAQAASAEMARLAAECRRG